AIGIANFRDLPDAGSWDGDSRGDTPVASDAGTSPPTWADVATYPDSREAASDAGDVQVAEAQSRRLEASLEACPPAPVAPDGFSNICATAPARGSSIIQTFPGECACNWTCECLMTSSVCQGLGTPSSCQVVNGATCNSVVVAVVICK